MATAVVCAECGVDAVGLVFVKASPRRIQIDQARQITNALPAFVEPIALFMDAPVQQIQDVTGEIGIGTVQLHGSETPDDAAKLSPLRVIKAMSFDSRGVSTRLAAWRQHAGSLAGLLWDASPPAESGRDALPGGTGRSFDWHALAVLEHGGVLAGLPRTILAGGLNRDNVALAISTVHPYAVDVSSGVESSRGVKAPQLICAFVQAVRETDERSDGGTKTADRSGS